MQADAEALPFADGEFDVVLSCSGAMFTPHHDATGSELARVCRPGGTIAMLNWTPEGVIGELFGTMRPYLPPPPPGASPPPLWGSEDHVRERFGATVTDLSLSREVLPVALFDSPSEYRDCFKQQYGRLASVLGGVSHLRHTEFGGHRPYRFHGDRDSASGRWEIWMDAAQAAALEAADAG